MSEQERAPVDLTEVAKQTVYRDKGGPDQVPREVLEFLPVFKKGAKPVYRGVVTVVLPPPAPKMPPQQTRIDFGYPEGTTLKQAFKRYDEMAEKAVAAIQEQMRKQSSIERATQMPQMLGPDGRPIRR